MCKIIRKYWIYLHGFWETKLLYKTYAKNISFPSDQILYCKNKNILCLLCSFIKLLTNNGKILFWNWSTNIHYVLIAIWSSLSYFWWPACWHRVFELVPDFWPSGLDFNISCQRSQFPTGYLSFIPNKIGWHYISEKLLKWFKNPFKQTYKQTSICLECTQDYMQQLQTYNKNQNWTNNLR